MEHNNLDFTINLADPEVNTPKTQSAPLNIEQSQKPAPVYQEKQQQKPASTGACSILSIDYWREYFDVTEDEIVGKVRSALNPTTSEFEQKIDAKVDLYGPFWISTTLIFCLIVLPRLWDVLLFKQQAFDIAKVGYGFTLIYGGLATFTFIFFGLGKFFGSPVTLFKTAAIYGYSYTIFLAAALATVLKLQYLIFIVAVGAGFHSVLFLLKNFRPAIEKLDANNKIIATAFIIVMQTAMTLLIYGNYL